MIFAAAALTLATFLYSPHHHPPPQVAHRLYGVAGWEIGVDRDTFTGAVTCSLAAHDVHFESDTLIFHLGRGVETTHAVFRVDGGAARPVAEAFRDDAAHGIFPQRGWIDDPAGGDAALPATDFKGAKRVWIRATPAYQPRFFNVSRFQDALAGARSAGCAPRAFRDPAKRRFASR